MARQKVEFLKTLGLDTRATILLNRVNPAAPPNKKEIEELVGLPVAHCFSNDYQAVSKATSDGRAMDASSRIGRECVEFAHKLLGTEPAPAPERKKGFLNFLTIGNQKATEVSSTA